MKRSAAVAVVFVCLAGAVEAQARLGPAGGAGGTAFTDACTTPREVRVRSGYWVDAIQLVCGEAAMPRRGGGGGGEHVFILEPGEQIRAIAGSAGGGYGPQVYSVRVVTDRRTSEEFGNGGPQHGTTAFSFEVPAGSVFGGIFGSAGDRLNQLGMLVAPAQAAALVKPAPPPASAPTQPLVASAVPTNEGSGSFCPSPGHACFDAVAPLQWLTSADGAVPPGALPASGTGTGARGEYVCRAYFSRGSAAAGAANGSIRGSGDTGCRVVVDGGRGGRRVMVVREYEVLIGNGFPGLWTPARGAPPAEAMQASVLDGVASSICMKAREGGRGPLGRVSARSGGCMIVAGGLVTVAQAYLVLTSGGS